ncbi:MAG: AMP-binding protein, partial [Sciscionella sp.]
RWLKLLSTMPSPLTAAPNFAYDYTASRVSEDERAWLQLDDVVGMLNGAEPVRAETVDRFHRAFEGCGLLPRVHRCSYGLAEATGFVAASPRGEPPRRAVLDRDALAAGYARAAERGQAPSTTLVSCGRPTQQRVRVVDPELLRPLPDGQVGEVWVSGPNVARAYWGDNPRNAHTFGAVLSGEAPQSASWLRTGDLGVFHRGELYVTGRTKDLIIVDGRNHYPQDVEETVTRSHDVLRPHHTAAFAVTLPTGEGMVVLAERSRRVEPADIDVAGVEMAVRTAVSRDHAVGVHDFLLLEPGEVPRTSSGKVARSAARERYLASALLRCGATL